MFLTSHLFLNIYYKYINLKILLSLIISSSIFFFFFDINIKKKNNFFFLKHNYIICKIKRK